MSGISRARRRYNLLLRLLSPALLLYTAWQGWRQRSPGYLSQRLGRHGPAPAPATLWLHAASVGEVNAALPLVEAMSKHFPTLSILVTTTTPSGGATARRRMPAGVRHAYLPIDWPQTVERFLARVRPECALIVETELWPNLFAACRRRSIPLIIINGRLSHRTLHAAPWLRHLYAEALAGVSAVLARGERDRERYLMLGANPQTTEVIGNLKFAALPTLKGAEPIPLPRPYLLAISTREGEEALLLQAWQRQSREGRLLVIVPRHPKRRETILRDLGESRVAVRSRGEAPGTTTEVYLADTFGELPGFIAGAELVYIGGSLVPKGGQNLLEPAAQGKALLFGPHMENFEQESQLLLAAGGARQVDSVDALAAALEGLLKDADARRLMGERAQAVVLAQRDMAERYLLALSHYCPRLTP